MTKQQESTMQANAKVHSKGHISTTITDEHFRKGAETFRSHLLNPIGVDGYRTGAVRVGRSWS